METKPAVGAAARAVIMAEGVRVSDDDGDFFKREPYQSLPLAVSRSDRGLRLGRLLVVLVA